MEDCVYSIKHFDLIFILHSILHLNNHKFSSLIEQHLEELKINITEPRRNYFIDFVVLIFLND